MSLREAFLSAWKGTDPGDALAAKLTEVARRARAEWPDVTVEDEVFFKHLGERAPTDLGAEAALDKLRTEDLYLTCACARGDDAALRSFDERLLSRVPQFLARLRADPQLVEETRHSLRTRLLLATDGAPPRIAQYSGLGALDAWVRVAAVRAALNLIDSQRRHVVRELPYEELLPAGDDLELDYLRGQYREVFAAALKRAVADLPAGERALLRFYFVDGLTPGHIGGIYGVHRTTTMRRIASAKQLLLESTRAHLMNELRVSPSECDSLVGLLRSHLPITLSSLFRSTR